MAVLAAIGPFLLLVACGAEESREADGPRTASTTPSTATTSPTPTLGKPAKAIERVMPCNPGSGFPLPKGGCPDTTPETGWLSASNGNLSLSPFRTLGNDAEGEAYALEHGEDYPFPNDYIDAPMGAKHSFALTDGTVCTGIILVGYREPLNDHVVSCDDLVSAAGRRRVPIAAWTSDGEVVQASELYRP